jgi:hypothetical protein
MLSLGETSKRQTLPFLASIPRAIVLDQAMGCHVVLSQRFRQRGLVVVAVYFFFLLPVLNSFGAYPVGSLLVDTCIVLGMCVALKGHNA